MPLPHIADEAQNCKVKLQAQLIETISKYFYR